MLYKREETNYVDIMCTSATQILVDQTTVDVTDGVDPKLYGDRGQQGETGDRGSPGVKGAPGASGDVGRVGAKGSKGSVIWQQPADAGLQPAHSKRKKLNPAHSKSKS